MRTKTTFISILFLVLASFLFGQNAKLFVPNQLLVQYKSKEAYQRASSLRTNLEAKRLGASAELLIELWELPKDCKVGRECLLDPTEWATYLAKNEESISFSQPNYIYGAGSLPPNDTAFGKQWYLHNTGWNGGTAGIDIGALAAWDIRRDAKYARVGIMDTGIDWKHPDLAPNVFRNLGEDADHDSTTLVWNGTQWVLDSGDLNGIDDDNNGYVDDVIGWDFVNNDNNPMDDNGHGTHVSGIIGAKQNNTKGISGIAGAGIQMMPLKCLDESGTGYSFAILLALQYSINQGAMVTNHSYGGGAYDPLIFNYINTNCKQAGQLLVAAAGNNHVNNDTDPLYPASYDSEIIISVGAHDNKGNPTSFSNFGSNSVDIFAPGDAIYSTDLNGQYTFRSGTSMAAPMVTAAVALAWKQFPASTQAQIKGRILNTGVEEKRLTDLCKSSARLSLENALSKYNDQVFNTDKGDVFFGEPWIIDMEQEGEWFWITTMWQGIIKYNPNTEEKIFINTTNSGLIDNYVSSIVIDSIGNKWFGTNNGLCKFDGWNWVTYNTANSGLPSNKISSMDLDILGNLWIGTQSLGLVKYNGVLWEVYNTSNSALPNNNIQQVSSTATNNIWIRTSFNDITKFTINGQSDNFDETNSCLSNGILSYIKVDLNGNLWASYSSGLICKFNSVTCSNYTYSQWSGGAIGVDRQNNIWINAVNGLSKIANNIITHYQTATINMPSTIKGIYYNKNNSNLIYLYGYNSANMHSIISINTISNIYAPKKLGQYNIYYNSIEKIYIDNQSTMWLGSRYGLIYSNGTTFNSYTTTNSAIPNNWVTSRVKEDNQGGKWFGTISGVVRISATGVWNTYSTSNSSLPNNTVEDIAIDNQGNKWIATYKWLAKLGSNGAWTIYDSTNSLIPDRKISRLLIDKQNRIWVGTKKGLAMFNGNSWVLYNNTWNVSALYEDKINHIWVGLWGSGLHKFNGNSWASYSNLGSPLSGSQVSSIIQDKQGIIWIGMYGKGIAKFQNNSWSVYNTTNYKLFGDYVYDIKIDSIGNKWIVGHGFGLFRFIDSDPTFSAPTFTTFLNSTLTFTNQTTDADSFTWKINNQIVSTATNLTYTFTSAGVHRVELIAHKGTLDKSFFQYITVRTPVQVQLGNDTTVCHASYVIDAGVAAEKYHWKNLAGTLLDPDSTHEEYYLTGAGTHTIVLEAVDYCGAVDRDTITVTISPNDCVLPGDVNADGSVDMLDFLALKALHGQTGFARPNASSLPYYQTCPNWSSWQPSPYNMVNKKHADCNGDGIIDILTDGAVIKQNATRIMRNQGGTDSTVYTLKLKRVNYNPYQWFYPWDTVEHEVIFSREDGANLVGIDNIAFDIRYNLNHIKTPTFDLSNSFMINPNSNVYGMVVRKGKNVNFGHIGIQGNNTTPPAKASPSKSGKIKTTNPSESIDTTHTTHSIFMTMTLNNATLGFNNGAKARVHSNTSSNTETVEIRLPWTRLDLKAILQGAYNPNTQLMTTALYNQNRLPKQHPYGDIPPFKEVEIPAGVVDWVEVQLRNANNPNSANIVDRRAAFLMNDGTIRSPYAEDSGHLYMLAKAGNYYVVIKHRNHLAVMSQTPVYISANPSQITDYDFTTNAAYNNGQVQVVAGKYALYAGDVSGNGILSYNSLGNDRESISNTINVPADKTKVLWGYYKEDVNLDGKVQYSGEGNDRAYILRNLGGTNVNVTIQTQVPQ